MDKSKALEMALLHIEKQFGKGSIRSWEPLQRQTYPLFLPGP